MADLLRGKGSPLLSSVLVESLNNLSASARRTARLEGGRALRTRRSAEEAHRGYLLRRGAPPSRRESDPPSAPRPGGGPRGWSSCPGINPRSAQRERARRAGRARPLARRGSESRRRAEGRA